MSTAAAPYGQTQGDERFWASARERRLEFQRCDNCGFVRWPASGVCPECLSRTATWVAVEGRGTVWSNVVYHRAYAPAWKEHLPYNVALVELDCGVRLVTRLVDMKADLDAVGTRVSVRYSEIGEHGVVPVFGPEE
jgi:hypothetical protein